MSFEVKKGEIFGFLGPNGAGKTATNRPLTGQTRSTLGSLTVAGRDANLRGVMLFDSQKLPSRRKHTSVVISEPRAVFSYQRLTSGSSNK